MGLFSRKSESSSSDSCPVGPAQQSVRERTIDDALDRANQATDADERAGWLKHASDLADSPNYRNRQR